MAQGSDRDGTFSPVRNSLDFPRDEARILSFWKEKRIFEKTLTADTRATGPSKGTFVFYEGPPTANGMPHNGHMLTRAVKDVFPRYWTMRGYDVPRKAGWDTHGLPVEVEVEKELAIHGKADIEAYGVEPFISRCLTSVFRYTDVWEKVTDKIGFWVDLPSAYVTYHRQYVESVWWALSRLHKKGLLYRGHRVCWWWPQGGTALSAAEVGLNYKTVDDPSAYVAYPLVDDPETALAVWTTTPWTLPSNGYAAVRGSYDYAVVSWESEAAGIKRLIVAKELVPTLAKKLKQDLPILREMKGTELVGKRYRAPFDTFSKSLGDATKATKDGGTVSLYWRVLEEDFVTLDAGTGIVHIAPAFGEDDNNAHKRQLASYADPSDVPLICAVRPDGTLSEEAGAFAGMWVKDADPLIVKDLAARGLLVLHEKYRHDYPYCWRADDDPLIQLARPAWYIRTTERIDRAMENNQTIQWFPGHIKDGRFGDFLKNNVDWALSRERFWGTPLNIWVAEDDEEVQYAPASVEEILKLNPNAFDHFHEAKKKDPSLSDHLMVHKPWIDKVTFKHPETGQTMRRVTEVIDAWFDSGSMPFAQWGYPHAPGSKEAFDNAFPADFISEAIDQTRGWFYSLLMVSTLVFDEETQKELGLSRVRSFPHPYKTCVVLGHICDREGKKESKSKGNYTPPEIILERVRMAFAVADAAEVKGSPAKDGQLGVAREDYEGLDFTGERATVRVYREGQEDSPIELTLVPQKGLRRRVVTMTRADADRLGVRFADGAMSVMPNDVPGLPAEQRVFVEDPGAPAPGADAFRWFFYAASPPWTNTRHSLTNVRATQKEFTIKLRNVYSFFVIYANIDGFNPAAGNTDASTQDGDWLAKSSGYRAGSERSLLDRWMLSEIALASQDVSRHLEAYRLYEAAQRLVDLVDALSNWYVRRSRSRFWAPAEGGDAVSKQDKLDATFTLYESLVVIARLIAPFTPFFAEELYQNLVRAPWPTSQPQSVHLCSFPQGDDAAVDAELAREMRSVRGLVSLGLNVRTANKLKVRQPLSRADVVVGDTSIIEGLKQHEALIREELNVKEVRFLLPGEEGEMVRYTLKPNFRALGPKLGKKVQLAKAALAKADAGKLRVEMAEHGKVVVDLGEEKVDLGPEEIEVAVEAMEGFAAAGDRVGVVVLTTALTDELRDEGLSRELLARIQGLRKELDLDFTERAHVRLSGSERVRRIAAADREELEREALATIEVLASLEADRAGHKKIATIDGEELQLELRRV